MPTLAQVECSDASLMLTSKVPKGSENLVEECGFYYGADKSLADATKVEASMDVNNFAVELPERNYGTTYYICSYITNGHGSEIRSDVRSYNLKALDKYIDFEPVEMSSYVKAARKAEVTFKAKIWSGVSVSEVGVCFGVTTSPSTDGKHQAGTLSEDGVVTATLSNFDVDTQYYLRAYVRDGEHTAYGEVIPMIIKLSPPTLSSVIVSSVEASAALFSSSVTNNGGDSVSEVGFYYSTEETVDPETSYKINQPYSDSAFGLQAKELVANTKYYVKAFAVNSAGTGYSQVADFTTSAAAPTVSTLGATDVTEYGALLSGNVLSDNGAEITERGFVWVKGADAPTTASTKVKVDGAKGEYSATLTDMEPNQKYSFRAYAINAKGTSYGEVMTFTTIAGLPSLAATGVSDITTTSAKFTSTITSNGGETVTEVGFYYSTSENIDVVTAEKVATPYVEDRFAITVSGLEVGTTYFVLAFAKNSAGEAFNNMVTFKTVSTEPTVATVGSRDITSSGAVLSGTVLKDNGEPVTDTGFAWMKGEGTPDSTSNKLSAGTSTDDFTATLTNLEPNQTYSYSSYATNSKGTAYGETLAFKTLVALPEVEYLSATDITSSGAVITAKVIAHGGETVSEVGLLYGTSAYLDPSTALRLTSSYKSDAYSFTLDDLSRATEYYVQPYATNSAGESYGAVQQFVTLPELPAVITSDVMNITESSAQCGGVITDDGGGNILAKGVVWSRKENPTVDLSTKTNDGTGLASFTSNISGLFSGTTYYVRAYVTNEVGTTYGEQKEFVTYGDHIEYFDAANSFIVSEAGTYMFGAVKGNSTESVGAVASVEVLWETFGTETVPQKGDLIKAVVYDGGMITFTTSDVFQKGNAVIAAKDASGDILWSWHIWLTDQPQEQKYYNNAGTMMDRNLGATSATPGKASALGLLYQWGRKDPFLGSASTYSDLKASSTITWPSQIISTPEEGTIEYTIAHPTTFIIADPMNFDWYYTGSYDTDNTRWMSEKTIYDPCPAGWRVPDGNDEGVWAIALGTNGHISGLPYNNTTEGMNLSGKLGDSSVIWYPASGKYNSDSGEMEDVGTAGIYWSLASNGFNLYCLYIHSSGSLQPSNSLVRGSAYAVRCFKEGTGPGYNDSFSTSGAENLSSEGTANSYIVSKKGTYSISAVKGNSNTSVGSIASAEVLWESYGTDEVITKGQLIQGAKYENGKLYFKTGESYREGNAVIAAKDDSGTILWSWHIWLTDHPEEHVYNNNAGTMMDRNLGATSATPGDVGALGLLYQWGRKDPFLGGATIENPDEEAKSTIVWPSPVASDSSYGTIWYATSNPTTFITYNYNNYDWCYPGSGDDDVVRWQSQKTIYDPCPVGWHIPDGGDNGVWNIAGFSDMPINGIWKGIDFNIISPSTTWYPIAGFRPCHSGGLSDVGNQAYYWATDSNSLAFSWSGVVPVSSNNPADAFSVRCLKDGTGGGPKYENDFSTSGARSLSDSGTANSYIVSNTGTYSISTVKGNSSESVGSVASAEVLWESFGTDKIIFKGDLIKGTRYENGKVYFKTADVYHEGNAVIAAKDASGNILWSWHIWLTDQPEEQVYCNNAGTMMDRNLGATSATPGDVGALGLLYQWGRKDPFLGSSSIHPCIEAKSTISWPSVEVSNPSSGTIQYATGHPTTVISGNAYNGDWYYTGFASTDDTRWNSMKTIYDPCPVGYRVPDGGERGIWNVAGFSTIAFDPLNRGYSFSISSPSATWYPAAGCLHSADGLLCNAGDFGHYWSATAVPDALYSLYFYCFDDVRPVTCDAGSTGLSVRCQKE